MDNNNRVGNDNTAISECIKDTKEDKEDAFILSVGDGVLLHITLELGNCGSFFRTCKTFYTISTNDHFWKLKMERDFGSQEASYKWIISDSLGDCDRTWKETYKRKFKINAQRRSPGFRRIQVNNTITAMVIADTCVEGTCSSLE